MLDKTEIYKAAIYIRLSKEDADRSFDESEGLRKQRDVLSSM